MIYEKSKCDPILGEKVVAHLRSIGMLGSEKEEQLSFEEKVDKLIPLYKEVLDVLGFNLEDPNLIETPKRLAKLYAKEYFYGMRSETFPKITTIPAENIGYDSFVIETNVTTQSHCSHHLVQMANFIGTANGGVVMGGGCTVAYIPKNTVLGLSKLNRVVAWAGARAQCQEQYCRLVVEILKFILGTDSVCCYMNLKHLCVSSRGAEDRSSGTITFFASGEFETNREIRKEFLEIARKG